MTNYPDDKVMKPPVPEKKNHEITVFEHKLSDDYYWLRERDNPEVIKYIKAENDYTSSMTEHLSTLTDNLYREMVSRIKEEDLSVPVKHGAYYYYHRTETGKEYRIYCRKKGSLESEEQILLDLNEIALDSSLGNMKPSSVDGTMRLEYLRLGAFEPSSDHRYLAYSLDTDGSENYTLFVKDLEEERILEDRINDILTSVEWSDDNSCLFYTIGDEAHRPHKVFRHRIGEPASQDSEMFHEPDERFFVSLTSTKDRQWIIIRVLSPVTSYCCFLSTRKPESEFSIFSSRVENVKYFVESCGDYFYVITDENARNFRLMKTPASSTNRENWEEIIPHNDEIMLEWIEVFNNHLVVYERSGGLMKIRVTDHQLKEMNYIEMPDEVYELHMHNNPEASSNDIRFGYSSMITPYTVYDYDMNNGDLKLKKRNEVPGDFKPENYKVKRIFVSAEDGVKIPVSIAHHKDVTLKESVPALLYGYGSYGASIDPGFSVSRLSILDRGMLFVIAHVRGGGEMGRTWHDNGKFLTKKNTFTDFVSVAEYMISQGWTSSDKLVIQGRSAGGLLMGSTVNLRPDLFRLVVAEVPFLDVINTMMDSSIPLTTMEYDEWGNPADKEYFEYMLEYSPYDNIKAVDYPMMFLTAGLNDPRVQYWEPAKWTAKLRETKTDSNPVLLKTDMGAGHGGPSGRYGALKETAFVYSVMLDAVGLND